MINVGRYLICRYLWTVTNVFLSLNLLEALFLVAEGFHNVPTVRLLILSLQKTVFSSNGTEHGKAKMMVVLKSPQITESSARWCNSGKSFLHAHTWALKVRQNTDF
jgi:hypothetical protein